MPSPVALVENENRFQLVPARVSFVNGARKMAISLSGVPETMLWTLHNRAAEAMRPDAFLLDPEAVRIYRTLRYDYRRSFGRPDESHAMRSWLFDRALRRPDTADPSGTLAPAPAGTRNHRRSGPCRSRGRPSRHTGTDSQRNLPVNGTVLVVPAAWRFSRA